MKILAIDTSCDDSCVAIIDAKNWTLLADEISTHAPLMNQYGGVVPELASREHLKVLPELVRESMKKAQLKYSDLDWVAVTNRPGLIGSLLVGVSFAKALAYSLGIPFTVLSHIESHLFSPLLGSLAEQVSPPFPWISLVVSGGHTELYEVREVHEYKWLGGTLDDAAGEAFDKIGKLLGLGYPAGPAIDRWVKNEASESDRTSISFPRAKVAEFNFSFSGLKTAVAQQIEKGGGNSLQVAASAQEAILDPLVSGIQLAKRKFGIDMVVVSGGVACNSRLREKLPKAYFPSPRHCSDNAAMVGLLAALKFRSGILVASPWEETARSRE